MFRGDAVARTPLSDVDALDAERFGYDGRAAQFGYQSAMIREAFHHADTLRDIARQRNMICSAAMCDSARMVDDSQDAQAKRLKLARESAGFKTASDFAKAMQIQPVTYRAYESGQNSYVKYAHQFAGRLRVSARWLIEGDPQDQEAMREDDRADTEMEAAAKSLGLALVPQLELGYSMGGGSVFSEYRHTGFVPFHRDWLAAFAKGAFADLFVARGDGDSMQPTLLDGDIVLIDTAQKRIEQQDRIWAISYGELGMIKRVRRLPSGAYRIMSDNPTVPPIDAVDDEMHVVGRVVWIGRRI